MPLPEIMAKTNRFWINPLTRLFAGKIGPFALLIHRGRTSGEEYRTPIMAFPTSEGFVIALTYGRGTDWEQNVLHEGGCDLIIHHKRHTLVNPRFTGSGEANRYLPTPVRQLLPRFGVHDFLRLDNSA